MKDLNTRKVVKRMVALFLAVAMCVNIPVHSVEADDTTEITLDYSSCGNNATTQFVAYINVIGATITSSINGAGCTWELDGEEQNNSSVYWWMASETQLMLILPYSAIQKGATSYTELYRHLISIPAGSKIGSMTVTNTINFSIHQGSVAELTNVVETELSYKSVGAQDGSSRYAVSLDVPGLTSSLTQPQAPHWFFDQTSHMYVDDKLVTGVEYYIGSETITKDSMELFLYYSQLGENVTKASEIREEHIVKIKKGTLIQDVYVTKDLTLRINKGGSVDVLNTVTPQWSHNELAGGYRNIYYTFTGDYSEHPLSYDEGKARLILGNKRVNCEWSKYESDGMYGVSFRVRENFLPDAGVIILEEGTSIGNCQVGESVYTQFGATDTTDYGTALIAVDNTLSGASGNATYYSFYIKGLPDVIDVFEGNTAALPPAQVEGLQDVNKVNLTAFKNGNDDIWIYFEAGWFGDTYTTENISNVSVIIPAGTIFKGYYFKNSLGVTLNETDVTDMGDIAEPEIIEVPDITLPDAIVVPADDYRNDTRTVYSSGWTEFYFKTLEADPLPTNDLDSGIDKYQFATGGLYLNDSTEPMSIGGVRKWLDDLYYFEVGFGEKLKAGDVVTLKGTVEVSDVCVAFQETKFYVDENSHIALWDGNTPYESVLEDVYVDLDENAYTIPTADSITVNEVSVDVETGRKLSDAGDYTVERVDGHVTYKQNVICYRIGDANADGKRNVVDLVVAKKSTTLTTEAKEKGADVTNDSKVDDADLTAMRELLVGKTSPEDASEKYQEFVFGVISDTHIAGDTENVPVLKRREKFKKALTYYKSNNAKLIIINGDVSDLGTVESYEVITDIIDEVYLEGEYRPEFIFTADNHEYFYAWWDDTKTYEQCKQEFIDGLSGAGVTKMNNHTTVGGYDFISISSDEKNTTDSYAVYSDETVTYLETELAAAAAKDADKPIFVAIHQPEHTTVKSSVDLYDKLRAYPQVVLFTSHTHYLLNDERSIVQDEFTTVNTAATHYAWVREAYTNFEEDTTPSGYNFAQGLLVRVKGNTTEIDRYDIYNDQPIGVTWTITTSDCAEGGTKTYTDAARQTAASAPTFAENTEVTADWVTLTSCTLTFAQATPATQSDFVYRYKIVVKDSTGAQVASYSYLNDFWHKYMPEMVTFTIPSLDCFESYSFEITAEETYGKSSNELEGAITSVIESQSNS